LLKRRQKKLQLLLKKRKKTEKRHNSSFLTDITLAASDFSGAAFFWCFSVLVF
jgi:hypothetical protein